MRGACTFKKRGSLFKVWEGEWDPVISPLQIFSERSLTADSFLASFGTIAVACKMLIDYSFMKRRETRDVVYSAFYDDGRSALY